MKNEKITVAFDSIQPGVDAKRRVYERIMRKQAKKPVKQLIAIAAAIVVTISTAAFGGFNWFTQQFNLPYAGIAEQSNQDDSLHGTFVMDASLSIVDSQAAAADVSPPAEVMDLESFWQGIDNAIFNPPLDPVDTHSISLEPNRVEVIFICDVKASGTPHRNLSISTPGSFTIPSPPTVNLDLSVAFHGWRDLNGILWTEGALLGWETEVSGTLTLTAEWK